MINYNSSNVVQCLRQYDMFANSLNLVKVTDERNMIINQLTKLEKKIIDLTNEIYEEEYHQLADKKTGLLDEEKARLSSLIELINQRITYIEKRNNSHYQLTGEIVDVEEVLGTNLLDTLEERLQIIEKYQKNIKTADILKEELISLSSKISLTKEKIDINDSLNQEMEKKMIKLLSESFENLGLYQMLDNKDGIEYAYYETEKNYNMARQNYESAKTSPTNLLEECQEMMLECEKDYIKYKEKICILKLLEIYNREVINYDELLIKRKEMNELIKNIKEPEIMNQIYETLSRQYETIMLEIEDVNTYNELVSEESSKREQLNQIEEENNSETFTEVLSELLENEKARRQKIEEERRKIEEEEKQRRMEKEREKQEEILRRQKIIEEARKKEIEKRTKKMLEQQQKSVIQPKGQEEKMSFETIKDFSNKQEEIIEKTEKQEEIKEETINDQRENNDFPMFKNKVEIEKELFEEFKKEDLNDEKEKKLPSISIDEYMDKFEEKDIEDENIKSLFAEDEDFPNIPL